MVSPSRQTLRTGSSGDVAFVVVVSVSYLAMISASFESLTPSTVAGLLVLGTLYTWLGVYGYAFIARRPTPLRLGFYFAVQIPLSGLIVTFGHGAGFNALLMLPLAGQAVVLLPDRGLYTASVAILVAYVGAVDLYSGGLDSLWNGLVTFLAGLIFVVVFTRLTVDEERARKEVERLAQELENANQRLRDYALQVGELATSRERNRLAREIHDGLGHYLTTIHMQIQAAQAVMAADPQRANDALDKARKLSQDALADVRQSVAALRSSTELGRPLPELVAELAANCQEIGLPTDYTLLGTPRPISPQAELACYRAVQEGLNNARKHSHASRVRVLLDYSAPDHLSLEITDNGTGSDESGGGFGLLGLRERVNLVGGEFFTTSIPRKGFTLSIEVPG